jgi:hypothetical protein
MAMHATDLDPTGKDIGELTSPDTFAAFLTRLGYQTTARTPLLPEAIGLTGESATAFKKLELLSEDDEQFLRVVFAQPKSLTAKARNDLARVLGKSTIDHLRGCGPTAAPAQGQDRGGDCRLRRGGRQPALRPPGSAQTPEELPEGQLPHLQQHQRPLRLLPGTGSP